MKKIFQILILAYFAYNFISKETTSDPFNEIDPPTTTNRNELGITKKFNYVPEVTKIDQYIEGETDFLKAGFDVISSGNYFYYDFENIPLGNVSALRISTDKTKISKVTCIFVSQGTTDEDMVNAIDSASLLDNNYCLGEKNELNTSFNALINAKNISSTPRLVIQILYDLENNEYTFVNITIKKGGTNITSEGVYSLIEPYTANPYVIDLLPLRGDKPKNYTSKILFFSRERELKVFYISDNNQKPINLFIGSIIVLDTNEDFIRLNYQGATELILLSDSLSNIESVYSYEEYRFSASFLNETSNIYYFISSNSEGRPLDTPISIEMTSCDRPYYYIMNYNKVELDRTLYFDTVFGEINVIKMMNYYGYRKSWEELIEYMGEISKDQTDLIEQQTFPTDVIELSCNLPTLVNIYYNDKKNINTTNLEIGDISIFNLHTDEPISLTFKSEAYGPFIYSFTVYHLFSKVNISITFDDSDEMNIDKNGIYIKNSSTQYGNITLKNIIDSSFNFVRVIFKFGLAIESNFIKDENGIYSNENDENREYNLYGYIYDRSATRYNYTGVDFQVSTTEENVKFCYNTNLGSFIFSSQNCHIIGKDYPYTISTLNPLIMHKDYTSDDLLSYYIGFRTMNKDQKLTIIPLPKKYNITNRNFEGAKNKVKISADTGEISTILTAPKNHEKYIFVETCLCTQKSNVSYKYLNAYYNSDLGHNGQMNDSSVKIEVFGNTKLDTELRFYNGIIGDEIFIKHSGYDVSPSVPIIQKIVINYNRETKVLDWTQPILHEKFEYNIYLDKIGIIKKKHYNLCDIAFIEKLPHIRKVLVTDSQTPKINIDISEPEFGPDFGEFDIIIIAEQLEKQKFTFISATYDSLGNNDESDESDDSEEEDEKSEFEDEEEEEYKEDDKSESENEEDENKGESEEKIPYNPDINNPDNSSDTLKIVLGVTIPVGIIIIALVVFFILRWKKKKSSFTKSQIENLVTQSELT